MKKYLKNQYLWFTFAVLIITCSFWMISQFYFDNDGWFILTNGRYILENGIPSKNPFTFVPDLDIIIQQWLWSVLLYWGFEKIGTWWIAAIVMIMYALSLFLFLKITHVQGLRVNKALPFGTVCLLLMSSFLNMRPTFVTIILLLWQVYILEKYKLDGKWKSLLWLIVISLLEINFHSAIWIFHFIFMLPYIVPEIPNPWIRFKKYHFSRKPLYVMMLPMFTVGFLNPYGVRGMLYLFYSYGEELRSAGIKELMAPATDNIGLILLVLILICSIWTWHYRNNVIPSSFFYIICGTGILSLSHTRNAVYFLLGFLLYGIVIMNTVHISVKKMHKFTMPIFTIAIILFSGSVVPTAMKDIIKAPRVEDKSMTPQVAVEYFSKNHVDKDCKIYTNFNCGGFLEWHGYKSFMDPRPELYFKTLNGKMDIFSDYNAIRKTYDADKLRDFIKKYDFEWMIVNDNEPLSLYLSMNNHGKEVQKGNGYKIFRICKKE